MPATTLPTMVVNGIEFSSQHESFERNSIVLLSNDVSRNHGICCRSNPESCRLYFIKDSMRLTKGNNMGESGCLGTLGGMRFLSASTLSLVIR